jgi:hypothetical protein
MKFMISVIVGFIVSVIFFACYRGSAKVSLRWDHNRYCSREGVVYIWINAMVTPALDQTGKPVLCKEGE